MRTLSYAFLLGVILAGLDTAALFLYDGNIRFLDPFHEMLALYWRHGVAAMVLTLAVRFLRPQWSGKAWAVGGSTLLFFTLSFLWVHSRLITGVRLWEPVSLLASVGLLIAAWGWFRLWTRLGSADFGNPFALFFCLAFFSTWILHREVETNLPEVPVAQEGLPDITVVVFDTLRADRLSCYGYERPTSPNIDKIAEESVRFDQAFAVAPWTRPSVASLFTGLHPTSHGAFEPTRSLPTWATTIAEVLHAQGYQTGGFSANANISAVFGFAQGFDYFWCLDDKELVDISTWGEITFRLRRLALAMYETADDARLVNAQVLPWIQSVDKDRPTYTYVQYLDPHFPYNPPVDYLNEDKPSYDALLAATGNVKIRPEPFPFGDRPPPSAEVSEGFAKLYDAEIRFLDHEFQNLLDQLEVQGLLDENDWLILTSDHGEEFFEHEQWGHGQNLYDEVIRIPLIIKGPDARQGLTVHSPVSLVDLLPTLCGIAGAATPDCVGQPLQNLLLDRPDARPRRIYSEKLRKPQQYSMQVERQKLTEVFESSEGQFFPLFYDLMTDSAQQIPFVAPHQLTADVLSTVSLQVIPGEFVEAMKNLRDLLQASRLMAESKNQGVTDTELSTDQLARLTELGYIQ
jgi:arylsulfatase A-like enzyme